MYILCNHKDRKIEEHQFFLECNTKCENYSANFKGKWVYVLFIYTSNHIISIRLDIVYVIITGKLAALYAKAM
jgi:hypothetical protein